MSQAGFAEAISFRMKESEKVISSYRFFTFNGGYKVVGGRSDYFLSPEDNGRCTCPDYLLNGKDSGFPCKHILAGRKLGLI